MDGLSHYYIAPNMPFTGKIGFNGQTAEVTGSVWLEHQWGSIRNMNQQNCRWRWFTSRFNDGRMMAFRHWVIPPDDMPVHERNHSCMVHPDGRIEYGFPNCEMRFTPTRSWTVPGVDAQWNAEGLMETPFGNSLLKSLVDDSVFISKTGMTFWEGPMAMLEENSFGQPISMAYVEQYFQPRGGPTKMRTLAEQDLARELPIAGMTPRRKGLMTAAEPNCTLQSSRQWRRRSRQGPTPTERLLAELRGGLRAEKRCATPDICVAVRHHSDTVARHIIDPAVSGKSAIRHRNNLSNQLR